MGKQIEKTTKKSTKEAAAKLGNAAAPLKGKSLFTDEKERRVLSHRGIEAVTNADGEHVLSVGGSDNFYICLEDKDLLVDMARGLNSHIKEQATRYAKRLAEGS